MQTLLNRWGLLLLFILLFILYAKDFHYGISDQSVALPVIQKMIDPTLFKNDTQISPLKNSFLSSFASSANSGRSFYFLVPFVVLSHFLSLELASWAIYVVSILVFFTALLFFIRSIFSKSTDTLGIFLITLFFVYFLNSLGLADSLLWQSDLTPSSFGLPIFLFILGLAFRRKLYAAFILSGVLINIHLLLAIIAVMFLCTSLKGKPLKQIFLHLATTFLIGLPMIIPSFVLTQKVPPLSNQTLATETIYYFRAPHHYNIATWGLQNWINILLPLVVILELFTSLTISSDTKKIFRNFIFFTFLIFLISFIGTQFFPKYFTLMLLFSYFYRSSIFIVLVAYLFISNYLRRLFTNNFIRFFTLCAVFLFFTFIRDSYTNYLFFVLVLVSHSNPQFPLEIEINRYKKRLLKVLFLGVFVTLIFQIRASLLTSINESKNHDLLDACSYVKTHTPKSSIFLTPFYREGDRTCLERAIVVDAKSYPFLGNAPIDWWNRIKDIGRYSELDYKYSYKEVDARKRFLSLSKDQITVLRNKYHFEYLFTEASHTLPFEKLWQNSSFVIYRMN